MDLTFTPYAIDCTRLTTVFLHTAASPKDVLLGVSASSVNITAYATSIRQTPNEVTVGLAWHDELYGANQPKYGQILEIKLEGVTFWIGIIQGLNEYRLASGEKAMTIIARSRDATPLWREARRMTDSYPVSTSLDYIARQIAMGVNLSVEEIGILDIPGYTVHSTTQLADLPPWQMLTALMQPSGLEPYIDTRGRLKAISRDTTRATDITLADNTRLLSIDGSKARPAVTEIKVKWLDSHLTESIQQDRVLANETVTAGFFKLRQKKNVYFSVDRTQRAKGTRLVVKQSANSGLLPVCDEEYEQQSILSGELVLTTKKWVPALATALIAYKLYTHTVPDGVASAGGGVTIPAGRLLEGAVDVLINTIMMSIGTGVYEIWGTPYDMVHARNTTTAYNSNAKDWEINIEEIENDFVETQEQSEGLAVRELIYSYRAASSYNITIVDDPRIEKGDIIAISDGSRVYVTNYERTLTIGSPAVLNITGFRC